MCVYADNDTYLKIYIFLFLLVPNITNAEKKNYPTTNKNQINATPNNRNDCALLSCH